MIQVLSIFILFLIMDGCSLTAPQRPQVTIKNVVIDSHIHIKSPKSRQLIQRFKEYWHYRMIGDYQKAFAYELPYQQYVITLKKYRLITGGQYMADKILLKDITYQNNCAVVKRIVILNEYNISKKDKWCYVKDNWYHKFYQSILPPKTIEEAEFQ